MGREVRFAFAILGIVAVYASSGANADAARRAAARSTSSQPAKRSGCERRAHRPRAGGRRAPLRRPPVGVLAPASSFAASTPASPDPKPLPTPRPPDTTPPKFAGLQSAFACTPGPQRPGQTTPFNLTWEAAVDDVTPPALIVYDVYLATAPGGEDFADPTWTTEPGATSFRTPGLPSHGSFYFVVRARDQAGNEEANGVERHGVDPCV